MKNITFFEVMGCLVGTTTLTPEQILLAELQLLLDYGKIIKLNTFLDRNQLNRRVLQLQVNFSSKIASI